jgi:membrane fusion protein, multidrug efflux system
VRGDGGSIPGADSDAESALDYARRAMRPTWMLLLLLGCSASVEGGGAGKEGEDEAPKVDPRSLVEVATVGRGDVGSHLVSSASVEAELQATLVPETSGVVTRVTVEEGDEVRKGQLLATFAAPTLDGAWERASAELGRAEAEVGSLRRLFEQGAVSKAELDAAERALQLARASSREAGAARGFRELTSPMAGVVASRNLRVGEMAGPASSIVVVDPSKLKVVVNLPERDLAKLRVEQPASLSSSFDVAAVGAGRVARISPVVDPTTGTFKTTVSLDTGAGNLRPGQFVSVRIEVDRHTGVLTVPRRAVVWEEGKSYVFAVTEMTAEELAKEKEDQKPEEEKEPEGFSFNFGGEEEKKEEPELPPPHRKASRVAVKLGFEDGENAEIIEGVAEGASVVVVGNAALRDGARVRLPGDPTIADAPKKDEAPTGEGKGG